MSDSNTIQLYAPKHAIKKVTVFQDRAEVVREFSVELNAKGLSTVAILNLPDCIDEDSIRVDGSGSATIVDVSVIQPIQNPKPTSEEHLEVISKLDKAEATFRAYHACNQLLNSYVTAVAPEYTPPAELAKVFDIRLKEGLRLETSIRETNEEVLSLQKKLQELQEKESGGEYEGRSHGVRVGISVDEEIRDEEGETSPVTIILTYNVYNASWTALYNLAVSTATNPSSSASSSNDKSLKHGIASLVLTYLSTIKNSTYENWDNVSLVLSTASPQSGSTIFDWSGVKLGVWEPRPRTLSYGASYSGGGALDDSFSSSYGAAPPLPPAAAPAMRAMPQMAKKRLAIQQTTVSAPGGDSGAAAVNFKIEGKSTVKSSTNKDIRTSSQKVCVGVLDNLQCKMEWIVLPFAGEKAFIQAEITNTSVMPFLAGPTSIFLDGSFIAKSTITSVSPGEKFTCSLGADPSVKVTYPPPSKHTKPTPSTSTGIFAGLGGGSSQTKTNTTTHHQKIIIKNTKMIPIQLKVLERVPVSEDSRLVVTLKHPVELATTTTDGIHKTPSALAAISLKKPGDGWRWGDYSSDEHDNVSVEDQKKDGKICWKGFVKPSSEWNETLVWDVVLPVNSIIDTR